MKNLNTKDFSYKGQKSAFQSDDNMFLDDLIGNNNFMNAHTHNTDDKLSFTSEPNL